MKESASRMWGNLIVAYDDDYVARENYFCARGNDIRARDNYFQGREELFEYPLIVQNSRG